MVRGDEFNNCLDCARTADGRRCKYNKNGNSAQGTIFSKTGKMQYCPKYIPDWVHVSRGVVSQIVGLSPKLLLKYDYTPDWAVEEAKKRGVIIRYSMTIDHTINYPVFYMKVKRC